MKTKIRKVIKTAGSILLYMLAAVCLFALTVSVAAKKDADGAGTVFGYQLRIVRSDSMEKCEQTDVSGYDIGSLPVKTMLFIQTVPKDESEARDWYAAIKKGDVLTFRYVYTTQETITHRVMKIEQKDGGYIIHLQGDNVAGEHGTLTQTIDTTDTDSPNYVIGKVTGKSYALGWLVYALKTPVGIVCIVIVPCLIVAVFEIVRIVNVLGEGKRQKAKEEIEALKRKIARLEGREDDENNG